MSFITFITALVVPLACIAAAVALMRLLEARKMKSISKDARQFFASDEVTRVSLAFAMIVDTPLSRVLGNFYLSISKPKLPTRIFSSEAEALEWLNGYIE